MPTSTRFAMLTRLLFVATLGLCPGFAHAELILSFTPDGSPANFSYPVGGTLQVPVFLVQVAPISPPDITTDPLIAYGVRGTVSGGSAMLSDLTIAAPFSDGGSTAAFPTTTADLIGIDLSLIPAATGSSIPLGTFELSGGQTGESVNLALSDPSLFSDEFATDGADGFDAGIFLAAPQTTITVVPEPSAFLFLGLLGCVTGIRFYVNRESR